MPGLDDLGREVPEYEITRWTDGDEWHDGRPDIDTLRAHIGDPDFMMTVHFPEWDRETEPRTDAHGAEAGAFYNVVGGFDSWADFEVAVVDMYIDYG